MLKNHGHGGFEAGAQLAKALFGEVQDTLGKNRDVAGWALMVQIYISTNTESTEKPELLEADSGKLKSFIHGLNQASDDIDVIDTGSLGTCICKIRCKGAY